MDSHSIFQLAATIASRANPRSQVSRAWHLDGGISAQVFAFETVDLSGATRKFIVRRHGVVDFSQNPQIAADEFRLLSALHALGLPVPEPYFLDESNDILPTPYLVTEFVEADSGLPSSSPTLIAEQMAEKLVAIHVVDWESARFSFLPRQSNRFERRVMRRPAQLDGTLSEARIRTVLEGNLPLRQVNDSVLLHGDYWPGNAMWRNHDLVAVIDWEDAAIGDPLADIANCRMELFWAHGSESMHAFSHRYLSLSSIDLGNLPFWDLYAALGPASKLSDWGLDAETETRMRHRHADFVEQAIAQCETRTKF